MGINSKLLTDIKELQIIIDKTSLTQQDVANYLGMTRQTLSKIINGDQVSTSKSNEMRLQELKENKSLNLKKAKNILLFHKSFTNVFNNIGSLSSSEIEHYKVILNYLQYWNEQKSNEDNYMEKLNCHIQNFHMKTNPYYLYFHEFFHKDLAPLLTFDIDYENLTVNHVVFGNISKSDYLGKGYDLNYQDNWEDQTKHRKSFQFEEFIDEWLKFYEGKLRILMYIDHIDNQFEFLLKNVNLTYKKKLKLLNTVDISRLFSIVGTNRTIENVINNYFEVDKKRLLSSSNYRNKSIIKLINIVCGYNIEKENTLTKLIKTSDSETYNKDSEIITEIKLRRDSKMGK